MRRETTLPFVRAQAIRELAWLVCRLEASAEGRSPLVIAGEPVEDGTAGPDPAGTTSQTRGGGRYRGDAACEERCAPDGVLMPLHDADCCAQEARGARFVRQVGLYLPPAEIADHCRPTAGRKEP
jgi:hypothetical protein